MSGVKAYMNSRAERLPRPSWGTAAVVFLALIFVILALTYAARKPTIGNMGRLATSSTAELIAIVHQKDTWVDRMHRRVDRGLPSRVRWIVPLGSPVHPDYLKPEALEALTHRRTESVLIVPELLTELEQLKPADRLSADIVRALAGHGVVASNALPWLESAAQSPTNLNGGGGGLGYSVSLFDVYDAIAAVHPDKQKAFTEITNRLFTLCFPPRLYPSNTYAPVAALEAQPAFRNQVWAMTDVLRRMGVPEDERIHALRSLLGCPSPTAQDIAWQQLKKLAPDLPELRLHALARADEPPDGSRIYLQQLLAWAIEEPGLTARIDSPVRKAIELSRPEGYWMLADRIAKLGTNGIRFAPILIDRYFTNRITQSYGAWPSAWSDGYRFFPPFEEFVLKSNADPTGLLAELKSAALDENNRYRFDDAQVFTRLGGDPGLELGILATELSKAPASVRKSKLGRYSELVANKESVAEFLAGYLKDPDPQARRHALIGMVSLPENAQRLLSEIDEMAISDGSPIVRWQAKRTANTLRGLDPNMGLRDQTVSPEANQE